MNKKIYLMLCVFLISLSIANADDAGFDYANQSVIRRFTFDTCSGTVITDQAGFNNITLTAGNYDYNTTVLPSYEDTAPVTCALEMRDVLVNGHAGVLSSIHDTECTWGVSYWIATTTSNNFHMIINEAGGGGFVLARDNTGSQMTYRIDGIQTNFAGSEIFDGNYHHVVISQNGTSQVKVYINGSLIQTDTDSRPDCATASNVIMTNNAGADKAMIGKYTDIAIFNRTLDGNDANALYNGSFWTVAAEADTTPPGITLINVTSPAGGIVYDGTIDLRLTGTPIKTNDTTPTGRIDTNENALCAIINNDQDLNYTDIVAQNVAYNCTTTGTTEHTCTLPDVNETKIGLFNFSVGCIDGDGNDNATGKFTINITDGTGPTIQIGVINDHTYFRGDKPFTLNYTAFDNFATNLTCVFYLNSTLNQTNNSVDNGSLDNWEPININVGYWDYNVSCNDTHGNTDSNSTNIWVNLSNPVNPTIYLDGINASRNYELNTTAALVCNATNCASGDCTDLVLTVLDNDGTTFTGNPIDVNYTVNLLRESNFSNRSSSINLSSNFPVGHFIQEDMDTVICSGVFSHNNPCSNATDGNYSTYTLRNGTDSFIYENYTIPSPVRGGNISFQQQGQPQIGFNGCLVISVWDYKNNSWNEIFGHDRCNDSLSSPQNYSVELPSNAFQGILQQKTDLDTSNDIRYYEGRVFWKIDKHVNFTMDNRTDIKKAEVNVTGHSLNGFPKDVRIFSENVLAAVLPGHLVGQILNQTQFIVGNTNHTKRNFTFTTAGAQNFVVALSASSQDWKNITFYIDGFDLSEGNKLDFDEAFNGTFVVNETLSSATNVSKGFFDDFKTNVSGRWSYSSSTSPDSLDFSYTSNELILFISDDQEDHTVKIDYNDAAADLRNTSEVSSLAYYSVTAGGCSAGGGSGACPNINSLVTLYATDGTETIELWTDNEDASQCSSCVRPSSTKDNTYNFTLKRLSSDYTVWQVYINGSPIGSKDLSSLDFDNQIKLQWESKVDYDCAEGCQPRQMNSRWNLSNVEWGGAWLGRHANGSFTAEGNVTSSVVNITASNVTSALLNVKEYVPANTQSRYYLSANCNSTTPIFESVNPGEFHVFDAQGRGLCWRAQLNSSNYNLSPVVRHVSVDITEAIVTNLSIDAGDDGITDFVYSKPLNSSNSPQIINISAKPIQDYFGSKASGEKNFSFPISIITNSSGIVQVSNLQIKQNPNPVDLNKTAVEDCELCSIQGNFSEGIIGWDGLEVDFEGSRNITVTCDIASNEIRAKHSKYNLTWAWFGFNFIPNVRIRAGQLLNASNVTPTKQTDLLPFWNVTSLAYDVPINYSIWVNETIDSCLDWRVNSVDMLNTTIRGNQSITTAVNITVNTSSLNNWTGLWFYTTFTECNGTNVRRFKYDICSESICESCVHTSDRGVCVG